MTDTQMITASSDALNREKLALDWIDRHRNEVAASDTDEANALWRALAAVIMTEQHSRHLARHDPKLLEQCQNVLFPKSKPVELFDFLNDLKATTFLVFSSSFAVNSDPVENYVSVTIGGEQNGRYAMRFGGGESVLGRAEGVKNFNEGSESALANFAEKISERQVTFRGVKYAVPKLVHTANYRGKS